MIFLNSDRVHLKYEINIKVKSEVDERIKLINTNHKSTAQRN